MTVDIRAPNGDTVRFPDGTPDSTILDVMRREYGSPDQPRGRSQLGWGQWARDLITGAHTTEFPDAPEFSAELSRVGTSAGPLAHVMARGLSAITPDPQAQLDIIRRAIPDVEHRTDRHGNIMLRAPSAGVTEWAYLNRPGISSRDFTELGAGLVASVPFVPLMGAGASIPARLATGALAGVGTSVAQDVAATAAGSNQGIDPARAAVSGVVSAGLAPGVPSATIRALTGRRGSAAGAPAAGAATRPAAAADAPGAAPGAPRQPADDLGLPEPAAPPVAGAAADVPQPTAWSLGRPAQVVTPDGSMTATAVPEVVELSSLRLARGDLQPRDRSGRSEYTLGARERASQLDPERLMPSRVSDSGAPIVMPDGTVLSGNGRVMSINEAYSSPALRARADAYRARLGTAAQGMDRPVLVMRLGSMSPDDAARFADFSNRPAVAAMSVTERAGRDARALGEDALALYQGGDFDAPQNIPFLRAFMERAVTPAERASVSSNNRLTREGVDRMRSAVLASAYPDSAVISRMLESTDDNLRAITSALVDAAPRMAQLRGDIRAGLVAEGMDASSTLAEAVRLIGDLRSRGITPARYFAQADAFKTTSPLAEAWVMALHNADLSRPWSRERMAAILNAYADEARLHRTGGLFADDTTADHVLDAAVRKVAREWGDEAAETAAPSAAAGGQRAAPQAAPEPPPFEPGAPGASGPDDPGMNAATASLGPRDRVAGRGDEPINRYLERVASEPRRISDDPTRNELAAAATAEGIALPNLVARSGLVRRLGSGLRDTFVGAPLAKASIQARDQIGDRLQAVAGEFSDLSTRSAGEVARKALAEWIETDGRGSQVVQSLYQRVTRAVRGRENTLNPLAETRRIFDDLGARQAAAASELNKPALRLVEEALERQGGLTFQGLMDLRTQIGHLIDGTIMPAPGTPIPALKRLYGALSQDLRTAAHRLGGDEAVKALDKAITVSSMVADRRKTLAGIVGARGDEAPEAVVGHLIRLADGRGGRGDAAALLRARRVLGDDWDAVAGAAIRQLGADGDTFSVRRFLTRYENLSPNGRQILFRSSGKDDLADSLDNLAVLSRKFDELARMGNPSGTGNVATIATAISTAFVSPLHAIAGIAAGNLLARALARPLTAKATSRWASAHLAHATAPTRATQAGVALATQMLARAMSREGLGNEDELQQQIDAAVGGGR